MARYTGPVCRLCRRDGTKLFLKGAKCFSEKCPVEKRNFPPGQHGQSRKVKKVVGYGLQLREKQKARRYYRLLEGQFRNLFKKAAARIEWRPCFAFIPAGDESGFGIPRYRRIDRCLWPRRRGSSQRSAIPDRVIR